MQLVDHHLRIGGILVAALKQLLGVPHQFLLPALLIMVGCTPNSEANSAKVLSPDNAAIATCALNAARCGLRFAPMLHVPFIPSALAYPTVRNSVTAAHKARMPVEDGLASVEGNRLKVHGA
jgi:hypothetical protein